MTMRTPAAFLALLLVLSAAGSAHASIGSAVTASVGAVASGAGSSVSSHVSANQAATVPGSATPVYAASSGTATADVETGRLTAGGTATSAVVTSAEDTASGNGTKEDAAMNAGKGHAGFGSISISRSDLSNAHTGDDAARLGDATSTESFKAQLKSALHADENLSTVTADQDGMDLEYRESGRVLGIIPAHLIANIHVAADGTVTVRYPWYHLFMTTDHSVSELTSAISAAVAANLHEGNATASGSVSGSEQTTSMFSRLFSRIESILRGDFPASTSVSAGASGDVQAGSNAQ